MDQKTLTDHKDRLVSDLRTWDRWLRDAIDELIERQEALEKAGGNDENLRSAVERTSTKVNNIDQARRNIDQAIQGITGLLQFLGSAH